MCGPRTSRPLSGALDSAPLGRAQLGALAAVATRELIWGLRSVSLEVERWHGIAATIPDGALRRDALAGIARKRTNIEGAALFWTVPRNRSPALLRLLVAYEILADYLDCISERAAHAGIANGLRLHRALVDALNGSAQRCDYYRDHPWSDDGGYMCALVESCAEECGRLPSYAIVKPLALRAAHLTQVLPLNHEPDCDCRVASLRTWAEEQVPDPSELEWWERTAGASAWLTILALLALAADPAACTEDAERVYAAYMPWVSLTGTMLDSYGDLDEDRAKGDHSYVAHYRSIDVASRRIASIAERSLREVRALRDGHRHAVIVGCMIAMYLTKDSTRTPPQRATTSHALLGASGALTRALVPVLRAWRALTNQRAT